MSKFKIVIADDEPLSLRSEEMLIQKEFPSLQICGKAEDGIMLKQMIEKQDPDIAMIDIRMPGLTGIEVMELLKSHKKTHYIICTAYSNFDYIHTALNLKADAYLLKPAKRSDVIEAIQKTCKSIEDERDTALRRANAILALHAVNPTLESEIIASICKGKPDEEKFSAWCRINNVHFSDASCIVLVPEGKMCINEEVLEGVHVVLQGLCRFLASINHDNLALLVFYPDDVKPEAEESWIRQIAALVAQHLFSANSMRLQWKTGKRISTFSKVSESYQDCMIKLERGNGIARGVNVERHDSTGYAQAAKQYIDQNFQLNISLDSCAEAIGISPYYLSHIFRDENKQTFIDYLGYVRIEHAKEYCADPSIPLKEIGVRCGYSNINYFYKVFKKAEGVTIGDYRAEIEERKKNNVQVK